MIALLRHNAFLLFGAGLLVLQLSVGHAPLIGLPAIAIFLFGIIWRGGNPGQCLRLMAAAVSLWLFVTLIAVYFFSLTDAALYFGLLLVVGQQLWFRRRPLIKTENENRLSQPRRRWVMLLHPEAPIFFVVTICGITTWAVAQQNDGQHVYQGLVAPGWPVILTAIPALALGVSAVLGRSRSWIFGAIALWIALNSFYVTRLDTLYGADGWRHFGKIVRVDSGQPYEPTQLHGLLKFENEKVPNASLYTLLPMMHRLSGIEMLTLYRYSALVFFGPLLIITVYFATRELTRNRRAAQLVVLAGFLAPGFFSLDGYLNVRTVGIVFLIIHLWVWMRYLLDYPRSSWAERVPITLVAILAYPTTGYISLVIVVLALALKHLRGWRQRWPSLALVVILGLIFAVTIPYLDVSRMGVKIQPIYQHEWWRFGELAKSWFVNAVNPDDIIRSSFTIFFFVGLGWLWWRYHGRLFILIGTISLVLLVDVWTLSIFIDSYAPFSSRVSMILSVAMAILFGLGCDRAISLIGQRARPWPSFALGLVMVALLLKYNTLSTATIGWTPSNNELAAVRYIARQSVDDTYITLSDETTSAVGYALTRGEVSYSWYPNTPLASLSDAFVRKPTLDTLRQACRLGNIDQIYFIDNVIPPTGEFRQKNKTIYQRLFQTGPSFGEVDVYHQNCLKILPSQRPE